MRTNEKQHDMESYTFNVKECNAMIIEINDKKFYIIFAQFKQQQKEIDRNTVETIIVRRDQSKHCTSFDVARSQMALAYGEDGLPHWYVLSVFVPAIPVQGIRAAI